MERIEHKGYTIEVYPDEDPINPRHDFDHVGTMVCFHPRYDLGDKDHGFTPETLTAHVALPGVTKLPLFLLDHSGLTISTGRYVCDPQGWDTSLVGFIFVDAEKAAKEGIPEDHIEETLRAEVEEYDQYLTGAVYCYRVIGKLGEVVHSCGGFFGYDHEKSGLLESAKGEIEADIRIHGEQTELFETQTKE